MGVRDYPDGKVVFKAPDLVRSDLTKLERAKMLEAQNYKCATPDCHGKPEIAEHTDPVAMGNTGKPDKILCRGCAKTKTDIDIAIIAAGHRKAGRTGQYARRQRRGGTKIPKRVNPWPKRKFPKKIKP